MTAPLTSDQRFVGLWRCHFLLRQVSNPPSVHLTTPRFKTDTPRGAEVGTSMFAFNTTWALGVNMTTARSETSMDTCTVQCAT